MKSKRLRNTTRSRNVKKTKRRRLHRQRTKRGGMRPAVSAATAATAAARLTYYHKFIPLLTQYRNYLLTKEIPKPSQGSVVPFGERHHTIFEGVEIDDGTKSIIKNMTEDELNHPVKWLDKVKTLYDKLISGLEEEERKRKLESAHHQARARGNTGSFTGQRLANLLTSSRQINPYDSPSASSSPFANTPSRLRVPLATIQSPPPLSLTSPQKPRTKSELSRDIDDGNGDGDGDDRNRYQVNRQLFQFDENSTPPPSPPGSPALVAPKVNNKKHHPMSPMRPLPPY